MAVATPAKAVIRRPQRTTTTAGGRVAWQRAYDTNKQRQVSLKCQTAGELLAEEIPERKFLLNPWLREEESVLLYAPTGAGKSLFALSAAIAIAGGGRLLGWTMEKRAENDVDGWRVVYVDGEMHLGDIQARLSGLLAGAEQTDRARVLSNLTVLSRQAQAGEVVWFPTITDPEGVAFYRGLIAEHHANLIVFDNFSTLGEVEDENAASSFNAIVSTLLSLKQCGVATMLVHHAGKNGTFRGSSKLAATFEVIVSLIPNEWEADSDQCSDKAFTGASFLTEFEKVRRGVRPPAVYAQLATTQTFAGADVMRWTHKIQGKRLTEIREGLEAGRWSSQADIAKSFGVDAATISRDVQRGIQLGAWTQKGFRAGIYKGSMRAATEQDHPPATEAASEF